MTEKVAQREAELQLTELQLRAWEVSIFRQKNELGKPKDITRRGQMSEQPPLWVEDLRAMAIGPGAEGYSHTLQSHSNNSQTSAWGP